MKKQLFIEKSGFTFNVSRQNLVESYELLENDNKMIVRGVPSTILDEKNLNGRIYSYREMAKSIQECKENGLFENKRLTCAADDHPDTSYVKPIEASHVVIDAYIKEVNGKKVLFNDWLILDTHNGKNLKALIKDNVGIGTSIRGLGVLNESNAQIEEYQYLGTDVVGQPSAGTYTNKEYNIEVVIESLNSKNNNVIMKKLKKESSGQEELLDIKPSEMDKGGEVDNTSPEQNKEDETKKSFDEETDCENEEGEDEIDVSKELEENEEGEDEEKDEDDKEEITMEEVENNEKEIAKDDSNNEKEKEDNKDLTIFANKEEPKVSSTDEPKTGDKPAGEADFSAAPKMENTRKKAQNFIATELKQEIIKKSTQLESAKIIIEELLEVNKKLEEKLKFVMKESVNMVENTLKDKEKVSDKLESTNKENGKIKGHLVKTMEALDLMKDIVEESVKSNKKVHAESSKANIKYSSLIESKVIQSNNKQDKSTQLKMGWMY